jgi:tetratricopeptide (TPR) repeat protein
LKPNLADSHNHLGNTLQELGRFDEAEASYRKSIALKPDYAIPHNNLGNTMQELGRFHEAEISYKQAIALKPNYAKAYNNLGVTLQELGRLDEAETSLRQAIVLKPDFAETHGSLGCIMYEKGDLDSASHCFKKAFNFDSNLRINELRLMVLQSRATHGPVLGNSETLSKVDSGSRLHSNPLILSRAVEIELIEKLYDMTSRPLDKTKDGRYGNGSCSLNFQLFEDKSSIIKTVSSDLIRIMSDAVKSKVYVYDSFFNILGTGGGSHPHNHLQGQDNAMGLWKQKYSLVYYLSVGDQDCSEPGVLKFYSPDEDILPCEGMIVITPATRQHSAIYGGKTDRVMIGVNFFSL